MKQELLSLREAMSKNGIDCYIVPTDDFHGSEYLHDWFKTRRFVSGFTGSAGTLAVTAAWAGLWTDGRYFLQAADQLAGSGIELMRMGQKGVPEIEDWLATALRPGSVLGFDGRTMSFSLGDKYEKLAAAKGASVRSDLDLVGDFWQDRPQLRGEPIVDFPIKSAGLPYEAKIAEVRDLMEQSGADWHLITGLEENAWLYNLRGSDVACTPVFFSFTLISPDKVSLYIFDGAADKASIPAGVETRSYFDIWEDIAQLPAGAKLSADLSRAAYQLIKSLPAEVTVIDELSPVTRLKAVKNEGEIASTREAHLHDGAAMVEFICWLKKNVGSLPMTEISVSDYLEARRREQPGFIDLSFDTISGYEAHGAIIHYSATPETDIPLAPRGFLLVDSGGQYIKGTTDITRTIALGPISEKQKKIYTAVLRGHIDLAMARFGRDTTGLDLDLTARAPIRAIGCDFNHGTGHGVGHVLSVHEGPNSISPRSGESRFVPGMITSDEPGVYLENEFGVRIEGEILCLPCDDGSGDCRFDMITRCPYEPAAIIREELTAEELSWLNSYHRRVYEDLAPLLSEEARAWLREETREI